MTKLFNATMVLALATAGAFAQQSTTPANQPDPGTSPAPAKHSRKHGKGSRHSGAKKNKTTPTSTPDPATVK